MNNRNYKKQQGITLIALMFVLAVSFFFLTLVVKMLPYYIENIKVTSSLESIVSEFNSNKIKPQDIKARLVTRLNSNDVAYISENQIMISGGEEHTRLSIEYEVRIPFMGNIDAVMKFSNSEIINL